MNDCPVYLESVMESNDEGMFDISQDVSLHLRPDSIPNLERGFSQDLHGVQGASIFAKILPDKEDTAE